MRSGGVVRSTRAPFFSSHAPPSQSQFARAVLPEQAPVPDVPAYHLHTAVPGLIHDRPLRRARNGRLWGRPPVKAGRWHRQNLDHGRAVASTENVAQVSSPTARPRRLPHRPGRGRTLFTTPFLSELPEPAEVKDDDFSLLWDLHSGLASILRYCRRSQRRAMHPQEINSRCV